MRKSLIPISLLLIAVAIGAYLVSCKQGNSSEITKVAPLNFKKEKKEPLINVDSVLKAINAPEKTARIDSLMHVWQKKRGFNGTILVAQQGIPIYKGAFGYADLKKKDTLTINSSFQLASVSKQFTAVAILQLYEKGKLSLDDTIQKFFPDFPYKGITIHQLLSHRSGLGNYTYFTDRKFPDNIPLSNMDIIQFMIQNKPGLYNLPNRKFNYSNTGYCVLAAIVEKISGMKFEKYMKINVFDPLEMKSTFIYNMSRDSVFPNMTFGYEANNKKVLNNFLDGVVGDKNVYSSVEDLLKWDQALYSETLLKQTTLDKAFTPTSPERKGNINYGYGWRTNLVNDSTKIVFHRGWWHGYNSFFSRMLKDKITIIILSNKTNKSIYNVSDLEEILYSFKP